MTICPTIIVPAFSRPRALLRLLRSLNAATYPASGVRLVISLDGGATAEVARIAEEFVFDGGDHEVISRDKNLGLRDHLLWCGDQTARRGPVVVLEEDLFVDPLFYLYAIAGLDAYADDSRIAGVALYSPGYSEFTRLPFEPCFNGTSAYFMRVPCSWGQAWTADQWSGFRQWLDSGGSEGLTQFAGIPAVVNRWPSTSWKKLFAGYLARTKKYFVYPYQSYSTNFSDAGGTNMPAGTSMHQVPLGLPGRPHERWSFGRLDDATVKYDAFMEPDAAWMEQLLGLHEGSLCVDLYAQKSVEVLRSRPLCLTSRPTRKVLRRFDLVLRPIELNMYCNTNDERAFFSLSSSGDVVVDGSPSRVRLHTYFSRSPIFSLDFLSAVVAGLVTGYGVAALREKISQPPRES